MKKNLGAEYNTDIDDNISFHIDELRTDITTNIKLVYDGYNLSLNTFNNDNSVHVYHKGLYNKDLCKYWKNNKSYISYNTTQKNNINEYDQKYGYIAPLYLRKKLPEYFVIFEKESNIFDENIDNIIQKSTIVKIFDLGEKSNLGKYINEYVNQFGFKYDNIFYFNESKVMKSSYYGIDKEDGSLISYITNTKKGSMLLDFYRDKNCNIYFPYVLNIEFLFDKSNKIDSYFGVYCNAIDLYELMYEDTFDVKNAIFEPIGLNSASLLVDNNKKIIEIQNVDNLNNIYYSDGKSLFYIKDKNNMIYKIPQFKYMLNSYMYNTNEYDIANELIIKHLKDYYKFDKLTCINENKNLYETYINYADPTNILKTNDILGFSQKYNVIECKRCDDESYSSSLGFFVDVDGENIEKNKKNKIHKNKPYTGASICIKVTNNALKNEDGEKFIAREIHLTAKDKNIRFIHDLYFGKDEPYDDNYDGSDPNFGNMYADKDFGKEENDIIFGDNIDIGNRDDNFNSILTLEGECPFVGIGIIYKKGVTTLPVSFVKYEVTWDKEGHKIICSETKRINKETNYKDKVIEELLEYTPEDRYISFVDDTDNVYINEVRIYTNNMLFTKDNVEKIDIENGEVILQLKHECPFLGVGLIYDKSNLNLPKSFIKYDVTLNTINESVDCKEINRIDKSSLNIDDRINELVGDRINDICDNYIRLFVNVDDNNIEELRIYDPDMEFSIINDKFIDVDIKNTEISLKIVGECPFKGLGIKKESNKTLYIKYDVEISKNKLHTLNCESKEEYYDVDNIGKTEMIKKIFGNTDILSKCIRADVSDNEEIYIYMPNVIISYPDLIKDDNTGAYDKANIEDYAYILRDDNYKNLFVTEPMKPRTVHITRNGTIYFSSNGTSSDVAAAICKAINGVPYYDGEIKAYRNKNFVVLKHVKTGSKYNGDTSGIKIEVTFDGSYIYKKKINFLTDRYNRLKRDNYIYQFTGGCDTNKNMFIINSSSVDIITNGYDTERYIKTSKENVYARVLSINPYVDEDGHVYTDKCILTTDKNGKYISSGVNMVELYEYYFPKIGILKSIPIKNIEYVI